MVFGLIYSTFAWAADPYPPKPESNIYVNDFAQMLSTQTVQAIQALGAQLEQQTTAQVAVVTVPNLAGQPVEDYAVGLFRKWGIGQKQKNNGVLLLISKEERKVRIEVGYGLEGALPDARTGRILDEEVVPFFRNGDYDNGVYRGYGVLAANVAQEYQVQLTEPQVKPFPDKPQVTNKTRTSLPAPLERWLPYILIAMFILDLIFNRARITRTVLEMLFWFGLFRAGRGGGGGFGGGGFGGGSSGGGGSSRGW
jgi:uncharacterized protein